MDYYNIDLSPTRKVNPFNAQGKAFYYVDATAAGGVDTRITVTPAGQPAITLKPGQSFRLQEAVNSWQVVNADSGATFAGNIIIGSGDFDDNNATINGVVTVAMQGTPTVNLSAGTKVQEELIAYTGSYVTKAGFAANSITQVLAPAANTNGVIVNRTVFNLNASGEIVLLAKASAPANITDGDMIDYFSNNGTGNLASVKTDSIKVPAGKGLYLVTGSTVVPTLINAITYTVLP
jgi:hypothetical protein